jgi:protein-ribulosamine 3-kinase
LDRQLRDAVLSLLSAAEGFELADATIVGSGSVGGGSINRAERVELSDGRSVFVKSNPAPLPAMFACEAAGLAGLHANAGDDLRVPAPIGHDESPLPFIVLEHIDSGRPSGDFSARLGRGLAALHRRSAEQHRADAETGRRYGFEANNYIGSTPQENGWIGDWVAFFGERRLGFQLRLAADNGFGGQLGRLGDALLARLDELIGAPGEALEPACLLHGDLWGGNYLCDAHGQPVLIDPAVYYGRREAELAMTTLFGGFDRRFYAAYEEAWPLQPGSEERLEIYKLYHLLNHLNLFGGGYLGSCLSILRRFA